MRRYQKDRVRIEYNRKTGEAGTIDVARGCVGCEIRSSCYASKMAKLTNIDFFDPVIRDFDEKLLRRQLSKYENTWVRMGCISDPSLHWNNTIKVCQLCQEFNKTPVVITKCHKMLTEKKVKELMSCGTVLQITFSGFAGERQTRLRRELFDRAVNYSKSLEKVSARVVSAKLKPGKQAIRQANIVGSMKDLGAPIVDTPLRLFKTSPLWRLVDQTQYHRHLSPISGKLDNQRCAGLIIDGAYPCYSSCSATPTETDKVGCSHQCLTEV